MKSPTHAAVVTSQFGSRAEAYLTSAVHASGEDLDRMEERVGRRPDAVALDMGCGGGHVSFRLAQRVGRVVAYDLSADMLAVVAEEARRRGLDNVETRQGAAESLPFAAQTFDVVATRFSAHHWRHLPAGLAEMCRVLKSGGLAIVIDAVAPEDALLFTWLQSLELLRDPSHVRTPSMLGWRDLFAAAGFVVTEAAEFRIRLDFASWVARMNTPDVHVAAIRSLQQRAPAEVIERFGIEADGSFMLDTALFVATRA
ncbi:MAG: class I SAM-dependent methyltransferase [Roseiarcus sp.]